MKKILLYTISLILITNLAIPFAQAQNQPQPPPQQQQQQTITENCSEIATATQGIFVFLEEPIGGKDAKYCFRVCDRKVEKGVRICEIKEECKSATDENPICQRLQVLKASSGTELLYSYIGLIYIWAAGVVGIVSVLIIVGSGIVIITSAGQTTGIDAAKNAIKKSLLGLVILFLSGLILYTINPTFFV